MVKGLEKFREYFSGFGDNYVIIGGTACDMALHGTDIEVYSLLKKEFVKE